MSYKKWIINVAILVVLLLGLMCVINYKMDIYHYWKAGEEIAFRTDTYTRILKLRHISKNPDQYYGYIIGGSKAGVLDADLISKYDEGKFYNVSVPWGCFEDYDAYIQYIAENTSAKKIILHLSSIEALEYSREDMPAVITPTKIDDFKEKIKFLIINPVQIIQDVKSDGKYDFVNGGRNYEDQLKEMKEQGDAYFEYAVTTEYDKLLKIIFDEDIITLPAFNENMEALKHIVEVCKAHDINLQVVIGPTFISELYKFEGEIYWSYLRAIASLVNFWDFSGFNDVNRNPYNFINFQHYNYKVGDKMINIMYGKEEMPGFGEYIDPNNFNDYIGRRTQKYMEMEQEYRKTGTIQLFDRTDESYIQ